MSDIEAQLVAERVFAFRKGLELGIERGSVIGAPPTDPDTVGKALKMLGRCGIAAFKRHLDKGLRGIQRRCACSGCVLCEGHAVRNEQVLQGDEAVFERGLHGESPSCFRANPGGDEIEAIAARIFAHRLSEGLI